MLNPKLLLIGYGNTLRGDDGVGPYVVAQVAACHAHQVEAISVQQLMPELAALIAQHVTVIFVDAATTGEECRLTSLAATMPAAPDTHLCSPAALLALAEEVYGARSAAWRLTVPGADFGLGDTLSPFVRAHAQRAVQMIEHIIDRGDALLADSPTNTKDRHVSAYPDSPGPDR